MKYSKQVAWLSFDRTRRYCLKGFREEHFFLNLTVTCFKFLDIYIFYKMVILFILVLTTLFIILMVNWENLSFVCSALLKVLFVFHNSVSMQLLYHFYHICHQALVQMIQSSCIYFNLDLSKTNGFIKHSISPLLSGEA